MLNPSEKKNLSYFSEHKETFLFYDVDQLENKIIECRNQILSISDDDPEIFYKEQEFINKLIEDFLEEKERFNKVFKTELGSYYFILESGQSLRIKANFLKEKEKKLYENKIKTKFELMPLSHAIVFSKESPRKTKTDLHGNVLEITIKEVPYQIGTLPIEIGFEEEQNHPLIIREKKMVKIISQPLFSEDPNFIPPTPYHVGHPIVEIIK